jgi:hypothetical protein
MIMMAFLAFAAAQDAPLEPNTRADLEAVLASYKAAEFAVGIDSAGKLSCKPDRKIGSAELSVQTCIAASQCVTNGQDGAVALVRCIDKAKQEIAEDYRRDWLKSHAK